MSTAESRREQYAEYLKSPEWWERRTAAVKRAAGRCQLCNGASHLNVHHRTYERVGCERPEDLTVLCRQCHERFHGIVAGSGVPAEAVAPKTVTKRKAKAKKSNSLGAPCSRCGAGRGKACRSEANKIVKVHDERRRAAGRKPRSTTHAEDMAAMKARNEIKFRRSEG